MIKKVEKKIKKVNSQKGFTLLEILVVLTIMGFLIAMVAPRLAGIGNDAVDTICDTNQNRMTTYLASYFQQTNGSLPNNLTNLIISDGSGTGTYYKPGVQKGEDEGALSEEFDARNHFVLHYLNVAEVAELADLGIDKVFNLNDYTGTTETIAQKVGFMNSEKVDTAIPVLMTGIGVATSTATAFSTVASIGEADWGEPRWFGRIVLGMGSECDLITSGIISNAAHCPGGTQNEFATYNDYNIVVPRLAATADRIATIGVGTDIATPGALVAVAYDGAITATYDVTANSEGYKKRIFNLTEGQEGWQYETQCPEGHMYPEENDFWAIDLDNGGTIG